MKITFAATASGDAIAVPVFAESTLSPAASKLDEVTGGAVSKAIAASRFSGKSGQTLDIVGPSGISEGRVVLLGLGKQDDLTGNSIESTVATMTKSVLGSGAQSLSVDLTGAVDGENLGRAALGATLAAYRFDKYRTKLTDDKKPSLSSVEFVVDDVSAAESVWADWGAVADGVHAARDLVMEVPNILGPENYAKYCKTLTEFGLEVEVLGEAEMTKLGMGSLLGVGQGSVQESQLVVMKWSGADDAGEQPIAFVGKGVTFDTGGISLKPGAGMDEMKGDMGGSAAVVGTMIALAKRKANVNAIGVIGLVENMPDGNAQRPGDVVTSMSGQTIEILNTDAEGRLVLADALWYTQDKYNPKFMINLATLTGAILIALGQDHAGIFSNDDELADRLYQAGKDSDETVWRLPIGPEYDRQIDSSIADMKNLGEGRNAGSIAAAQFLWRFTNDTPWVHIDIAGTGMNAKSKDPRQPLFGTGFGVRLLDRLVRNHYEG